MIVLLSFLGLKEKTRYEFRVAAENKAGIGPYSDPSEPVVIKEPGDAPELMEGLTDLTVTSPETASLTCKMNVGKPQAKITWYKDGKELKVKDKVEMTIEGEVVTLHLKDTVVKDAGQYKIVAQNKLGKVDSKCELQVLSKFPPL